MKQDIGHTSPIFIFLKYLLTSLCQHICIAQVIFTILVLMNCHLC